MEKKGIIYKVTHKESGKSYIGATMSSIHKRKLDHVKLSKSKKQRTFYKAIGVYGSDAFKWEQIDTARTTDGLARKEKEYILKYNSKEDGYNSDVGGGIQKTVYQYDLDGRKVNEFTSLESAGNAVNAVKQNISAVAIGENKTCKGYCWSYSPTFPKGFNDERKKRVLQYSLYGEYINDFESVSEASKQTDCNKTSIAKVCRGERKSCGGYFWSY
jgi:group I intron endonuclease